MKKGWHRESRRHSLASRGLKTTHKSYHPLYVTVPKGPIYKFKVVPKSREVMGDYIALHGLVPKNELPHHLRGKIPKNEIWVREDRYNDPKFLRSRMLYVHEGHELKLMEKGMTYKKAHKRAEIVDLWW